MFLDFDIIDVENNGYTIEEIVSIINNEEIEYDYRKISINTIYISEIEDISSDMCLVVMTNGNEYHVPFSKIELIKIINDGSFGVSIRKN